MRIIARYALAAFILIAAAVYPFQYVIPVPGFGFVGDNGFSDGPQTVVRVMAVMPDAASTGIHVGDALPLAHVDARSRAMLAYPKPGDTARFEVRRGAATRWITLRARALYRNPFGLAAFFRALANAGLGLFALIIIIRAWNSEFGPAVAALTAAAMIDAAFDALPWTAHTVNPLGIALFGYGGGIDAIATIGETALIAFIGLRVAGSQSAVFRTIAWCTLAYSAFLLVTTPATIILRALGSYGGRLSHALDLLNGPLLFFVAAATAAAAYACARGEAKRRMAWLFLGTFPYFTCIGIINLPFMLFVTGEPWFIIALRALELTLPAALAYGLLFRRVIDTGFILSQVAVYALTSLVLAAVFIVLEFAVSRILLDGGRVESLAVQVLGALAIGLSSRYLHAFLDRAVDRVVFAKRHADETALRRFAREAQAYHDEGAMLDRATAVLAGHTDARGIAIYVERGDRLAALRRSSEEFPQSIPIDDALAVKARGWAQPVDTHEAPGLFPDGMLFPMAAYGRVVGILACQSKRDATAFDPDERESLESVAHALAAALQSSENGSNILRALHVLDAKIDRLITS